MLPSRKSSQAPLKKSQGRPRSSKTWWAFSSFRRRSFSERTLAAALEKSSCLPEKVLICFDPLCFLNIRGTPMHSRHLHSSTSQAACDLADLMAQCASVLASIGDIAYNQKIGESES